MLINMLFVAYNARSDLSKCWLTYIHLRQLHTNCNCLLHQNFIHAFFLSFLHLPKLKSLKQCEEWKNKSINIRYDRKWSIKCINTPWKKEKNQSLTCVLCPAVIVSHSSVNISLALSNSVTYRDRLKVPPSLSCHSNHMHIPSNFNIC